MKIFLSTLVVVVFLQCVDCICVQTTTLLNQGLITIDPSCRNASGTIYTDNAAGDLPYMYMKSGYLGDGNLCTVHDTTAAGAVLGTFRGYGDATGAVKGTIDQLYYYCELEQSHGEIVFSYQIVLFDDCGGSFNAAGNETIVNPTISGGSTDYPHCALCRWEFTHPFACDFNVVLLNTYMNSGDFIFLNFGGDNSSDNVGTPSRFGSASGSAIDNGHRWQFRTSHLRIEFVSDNTGTSTGFGISVRPDCGNLYCGEIVYLRLDQLDLSALNATAGDILLISPNDNAQPEDVDDACKATFESPNFTFNLTFCGAAISQTANEVMVTYTVRKANILNESNPIQRFFKFSKNFTCVFQRNESLTAGPIVPEILKVGVGSDPVSGEFNIELNLYDSEHFNVTSPAEVVVPRYVYAQAKLSEIPQSKTNFVMQMIGCWATQQEDSASEPSYPIIVSSCESVNNFESSANIEVLRNHAPIYGRFKFKSFVWTNFTDAQQRIYVHCDVNVCDNDVTGSNCSQPACGRKRRDVGGIRTLSAGPILVSALRHHRHDVIDHYEGNSQSDQAPAFILVVFLIATSCLIVYYFRK